MSSPALQPTFPSSPGGHAQQRPKSRPFRVIFPYIAQIHQTLHSLPIAAAIAELYPDVDVYVAAASNLQLNLIKELAAHYPNAPLRYIKLETPFWGGRTNAVRGPSPIDKLGTLLSNKNSFNTFDAIIVPERTCLYLRHMGVNRPKLIYTGHGAGDRAVGFAHDIKHYDFVLVPGRKIEERLLRSGAITPGRYFRGVYAKFDLMRRMGARRQKLFTNDRPTVVYNPHFSSKLTSWRRFGPKILEYFAHQDRFNLIFAPHYRLFDRQRRKGKALIEQYRAYDHMIIDPGSLKSVDMTYTMTADIYLGDVSSQVAEFVTNPRPCIFLNAHNAKWENNPNYYSWTLGDVIHSLNALPCILDANIDLTHRYKKAQTLYVHDTFDFCDDDVAPDAANAIIEYLTRSA